MLKALTSLAFVVAMMSAVPAQADIFITQCAPNHACPQVPAPDDFPFDIIAGPGGGPF